MAAIFASTASAAGLISLAVQALDSAAKVKRCYNSFKHAPQEIKDLVAELELNQELLTLLNSSTIGQGQQAQTIGQSQTLVKCTKLCDGIQKDLEGVLNPLQAQLMTNPKRGAARYVFAEGHIKEWLVKLERAKSMLVVVLAETNSYRTSTQLESIQAGVTNISTSQQAFGQQIGNLLSTSNDTTKQGRSAVDEWKAHIRASNAVFQSQSKDTQEKISEVSLELGRLATSINAGTLENRAIRSEVDRLNHRFVDLVNLPEGRTIYRTQRQRAFKCFFIEYSSSTNEHVSSTDKTHLQQSSRRDRNGSIVVRLKVVMPTLLYNYHLALICMRSISGWTWCFRSYKTLPNESIALEACMKGEVGKVRDLLSARELSLYDESCQGLNMLQVAAYAHQDAICHFLIQQGLQSRGAGTLEDSALYHMLYVNPGGIPSMERSIELFRYLERHDDIERSELDSEVARLFFTYPDWSHSEHLIFLIKLYSRSAIIHVRSPHDPSEDDRAEAFMKDLTRWRDEPLMLSLTVARIGRISSVLQLAARYFAYTAFTNTELDQGSVDGWRKICLKAVLAGADLQGNFENQLDWDSPLGMAIENVMSTMWAYEIEGHMQYKLVSRFLKAWLSLLNDAGVNIPQYVLRESRLLKKVKSRLIDEVPKKRSPQTLQDLWVNWLLSGVRLKRTHRSPRWRLQWPPAASIGKLSGPRKSHILDQATSGHFQHYLHIPGAWGSPEEPDCQADSLNGLPSESVDTEQQSAPVNSMTSSTHKLGFPCTSSLFNHSVQGEAYRKLRLGKNDADALSSSADGSIYPIHEEGCKCRRCLQENDRRKRARQKTRKLLNQVSGSLDELRMDSGGGSGCGHPLPRDPPQPRDPCAV